MLCQYATVCIALCMAPIVDCREVSEVVRPAMPMHRELSQRIIAACG